MFIHVICINAYISIIIAVKHALQFPIKFQLKNFFFDVIIHHIEFIGILMNIHVYLHHLLHFFSYFMSHAVVNVF